MEITVLIILAIFVVAVLYSSVGHGGASGYLAVMAFAAVAPEVTRPTALVLNLFVASIGTFQFWRAGHLRWRVFWPFAVASIPFALLGGAIQLPMTVHKFILGIVLCIAAVRLAIKLRHDDAQVFEPPIGLALLIGASIGLVSGVVGVGGGIFLAPVLVLARWAETKTAAAVSVLFILVNSLAGLAGNYFLNKASHLDEMPAEVWIWVAAAVVGGLLGSTLGAKKFNSLTLRRVLALVLVFAGVKLIFV